MLEAIRKRAGSFVVKILFVILVLSFFVWGIADVFRPGSSAEWAAEVGDRKISTQALQRGVPSHPQPPRQLAGQSRRRRAGAGARPAVLRPQSHGRWRAGRSGGRRPGADGQRSVGAQQHQERPPLPQPGGRVRRPGRFGKRCAATALPKSGTSSCCGASCSANRSSPASPDGVVPPRSLVDVRRALPRRATDRRLAEGRRHGDHRHSHTRRTHAPPVLPGPRRAVHRARASFGDRPGAVG